MFDFIRKKSREQKKHLWYAILEVLHIILLIGLIVLIISL